MTEDRLVVYSAVYGPHDYAPGFIGCAPSCDCILFTDDDALAVHLKKNRSPFRPVIVRAQHNDPRKACRQMKCCPDEYLPAYNVSLWVDANVAFLQDPAPILRDLMRGSRYAVYRHWNNVKSAYFEARRCVHLGKVGEKEVESQVQAYRDAGYDEEGPIAACGVIARRHHDVAAFGRAWWHHVFQYSHRDQISWAYTRWATKLQHSWIDIPRQSWIKMGPHVRRKVD